MYDIVFWLLGIAVLIFHICLIAYFVRMCKNVQLLTDFFIKGIKPMYDPKECDLSSEYNLYYKIGENISNKEWNEQYTELMTKINSERKTKECEDKN